MASEGSGSESSGSDNAGSAPDVPSGPAPSPSQPGQPGQQPTWSPGPGYDPSVWQPSPQWRVAFDPRYGYHWIPAAQERRRGHGCLIAFLLALGAIVILVVGCVALVTSTVLPAIEVTNRIQSDSNSEVRNAAYNWYNGVGSFSIVLAPGVSPDEGSRIACQVVRPAMRGTQFDGDHFAVYTADGYLVADWRTLCG